MALVGFLDGSHEKSLAALRAPGFVVACVRQVTTFNNAAIEVATDLGAMFRTGVGQVSESYSHPALAAVLCAPGARLVGRSDRNLQSETTRP